MDKALSNRVIANLLDQAEAATPPAAPPSSVKLSYFAGRGLAETSRYLLALAGVDYEDKRYPLTKGEAGGYEKPEMEADAAAGLFDWNLGRLPTLDVDGAQIGGADVVARFIARQWGLAGNGSALQAAQIDTLCGLVKDTEAAFGKEDDKDKWFTSMATKQGERALPFYLAGLEKLVGSDGFAVGGKVSLADAVIYRFFGESATTAGLFGAPESVPMGNAAATEAALAQFAPKLSKIVTTFRTCPAIAAYLAQRPTQLF